LAEHDLETLSKALLTVKAADTPPVLYVTVPELTPQSALPIDQVRLEPYIRLKTLPVDLRRLVGSYVEAASLLAQIEAKVPGLPKASPTHYPSGIVELQWKFENTSVFGIALHGYKVSLKEDDAHNLVTEWQGRITWRFHGPRLIPQSGEFKSKDELLDFMTKSIITS
jgi:hypothetical protein